MRVNSMILSQRQSAGDAVRSQVPEEAHFVVRVGLFQPLISAFFSMEAHTLSVLTAESRKTDVR
jgi:hypothetical protein